LREVPTIEYPLLNMDREILFCSMWGTLIPPIFAVVTSRAILPRGSQRSAERTASAPAKVSADQRLASIGCRLL
jgi:hypothetical protein